MAEDIKEAKTEDLMLEAKVLHDKIYNIECYTSEDMQRLDSLYAEIESRGFGVVEQCTLDFMEIVISSN